MFLIHTFWMVQKSTHVFLPFVLAGTRRWCRIFCHPQSMARQMRCSWMLIGSGCTKSRWSVGWFGWDFVGDGNRWPTLRKALVEIWDGFLLICFCWGGLDRKNKLNKEFRDKLYKQMHWFDEIMWNIKLWFFHIQLRWDMKTGTN